MARLKVRIGEREIFLRTNLFEGNDEIDLDKILRIDPNYLVAETLTFSVILNKFGLLMNDAENKVKEAKIDFEVWYSQEKENTRTEWDNDPNRPVTRGYKYTMDQVTDAVESQEEYSKRKKRIVALERTRDRLNTIYWSAKSKDQKLTSLAEQFKSEDVDFSEIIGHTFNGVKIASKEPLIKG